MIDRINTIREALVLATDGPIVGRGELMQEALTALAVLEAAMKTPVAYVSVPDLKKLKKSKAADMYVRAFPPPAVGTSEIALYLAAPPAQQRNEWKEAVLDKLAEHCIDAPQDEPPASILSRIITMAVQMATDPAINTPAQQAQPTESLESLLSTAIGILIGYSKTRGRLRYKPGSVVDKFVNECVERLKDWPFSEDATKQAQAEAVPQEKP